MGNAVPASNHMMSTVPSEREATISVLHRRQLPPGLGRFCGCNMAVAGSFDERGTNFASDALRQGRQMARTAALDAERTVKPVALDGEII
jgi:hypothetical protein